MPRVHRSDVAAFMKLQPLHRDLVYFVLSVLGLAPISWLTYLVVNSLLRINRPEERRAVFTQFSVAVVFTLVSVLTPIISLRRLQRARIQKVSSTPSLLSLFKLRNPYNHKYKISASRILSLLNQAYTYKSGERVAWEDVATLTDDDKEYIRVVVEDCMVVKKNDDDGSIYFAERSPWLLVFSHLVLLSGVLVAGSFSSREIIDENLTSDGEIGKVLSEWMSNYVLLIVGFLQVVSRGAWFRGFSGICAGASTTMTIGQRNAIVALYIATAHEEIQGLRRHACYAQVKMDGYKWLAPPVSTAVIAAARTEQHNGFSVYSDDGWRVDWTKADSHLEVRMVGTSGGGV